MLFDSAPGRGSRGHEFGKLFEMESVNFSFRSEFLKTLMRSAFSKADLE